MSDEISQALSHYLETYLSKRDLASTLGMLNLNCSGYGTGLGERGYNLMEMQAHYIKDFEQAPQSINFEIYNINTQLFDKNSGYSSCEIDLDLEIANQNIKLNHLRISIFWTKESQVWKISHMHASFPTDVHEADEAFPVKELEKRNSILERLVHEKTLHLNEALERLTLLATIDKLTNLYNRQKIQELLEQEVKRANRYENNLSIIMIDIDFFKEINDTQGHNVGDAVLSEFANVLSKNTRANDMCGRWGGEEFLIISPQSCATDALKIAKKLQAEVNLHIFDTISKLTASFGVATFTPKLSTAELVKNADDALYSSKRDGRNQITLFQENS